MSFYCEPCKKEITFAHAFAKHRSEVHKVTYSDAVVGCREAVGLFVMRYIGPFDLDIEYTGGDGGAEKRYYVTYLTARKEPNPRIRRTKLRHLP